MSRTGGTGACWGPAQKNAALSILTSYLSRYYLCNIECVGHQQLQPAADVGGRLNHSPLLPIMPRPGWLVGWLVGLSASTNGFGCFLLNGSRFSHCETPARSLSLSVSLSLSLNSTPPFLIPRLQKISQRDYHGGRHNGGLNGQSSDSSAILRQATNSGHVEFSTLPSTMHKEEVAVEYIHSPRFGSFLRRDFH